MIKVPPGVSLIEKYPFNFDGLVVGAYGKPTNWKEVISSLQDVSMYDLLHDKVYNLGQQGEKSIVCPRPVHKTDITRSREMRALSVQPGQLPIYRGMDADGAEIDPGEVYALASGDCPTVAIHDTKTLQTTALHFNRENGVDNEILDKAMLRFTSSDPRDLVVVVSCGISPHNFLHEWDHGKFGETNRARSLEVLDRYGEDALGLPLDKGGINLRYIAAQKAIDVGVPSERVFVDQIDTYSDPGFWSYRASKDPSSPKHERDGRNLVLVGVI